MTANGPLTILCVATYEKGAEFLQECKRQGCVVLLLTTDALKDLPSWPREAIDEIFAIPADIGRDDLLKGVSSRGPDARGSTASSPSTTSTSRPPRCCASTCACPAWARPRRGTSATSWPCG